MSRSPGQVAFEAYNESKGGLTWDGKPIPPWSEVGDEVQAGWSAAARAVMLDQLVAPEPGTPRSLPQWQVVIYEYAKDKGWWDGDTPRTFGDLCMLMVTELGEAYEEYRNGHEVTEEYENPDKPGKPEGIPSELADVVIRILDFATHYGIDLQSVMERKHAYNLTRQYRHGGKRT